MGILFHSTELKPFARACECVMHFTKSKSVFGFGLRQLGL